jgi:hypothetical protein
MGEDENRRQRWEDAADWPLTRAAVIFLAAYAWPILDPGIQGSPHLSGAASFMLLPLVAFG